MHLRPVIRSPCMGEVFEVFLHIRYTLVVYGEVRLAQIGSELTDIVEAHIDKYNAENVRRSMRKSERLSASIFYESVGSADKG